MKIKFAHLSTALFYFCFFFADIVISEFIVRFFTLGFKEIFPVFMILFAISISVFLALICASLKEKPRKIVAFVFVGFICLFLSTQLVYHNFCGSFMSIAQIGMGGDAFKTFGKAALLKILESLGGIILLIAPIVALVFLNKKGFCKGDKLSLPFIGAGIVLFFALHFGTVLCLPLAGLHTYDPVCVYRDDFDIQKSSRHFGCLTTLRLEIRGIFFSGGTANPIPRYEDHEVVEKQEGYIPSPVTPEKIENFNITEIDFAVLAENETDEGIKQLHEYFESVPATPKNEYTGKFEGYNLIIIACESFSHHVIDPELTPTLYKLSTEGFIFNQYYNTVCDNTSNGEYALLTGLVPDTSLLGRGWKTFYTYNSLTAAKENLLPFCLAQQFNEIGVKTYAVHNHTASYYGRNETHPNMGYETFLAFDQGLETVETFPTSDVSMMEQALPQILVPDESGEIPQFHAYFLTFSGHLPFKFDDSNDMALKNQEYVTELEYSEKIQAYVACQLEVEFALNNLLEQLEEAGVLDKTLIAITNDHYPYDLGIETLTELAGEELDPLFDKYRSRFILWTPSIEEPIEVDVPCCSLDILPTLSNLMGIEYESRLLAGKDIFADTEHIAVLADRSFVTDRIFYNCTSGVITVREGQEFDSEEEYENYVLDLEKEVRNRFLASERILYTDYYRIVYDKNLIEE